MKSLSKLVGLAAVLAATIAAAPAQAGGVHWNVNIGVPLYASPRPIYVQPQPVYVQPQPVYVNREPRYTETEPDYVEPTVVYRQPDVVYEDDVQVVARPAVVTQYQPYVAVQTVPSVGFVYRDYGPRHHFYHEGHRGWRH